MKKIMKWLGRLLFVMILSALSASAFYSIGDLTERPVFTSGIKMAVRLEEMTTAGADSSTNVLNPGYYLSIIKSEQVLGTVSRVTGMHYSVESLNKMITVTPNSDFTVCEIAVASYNPEHSRLLADAVGAAAKAEILKFYKSGDIEILNKAVFPTISSTPSHVNKAIIGGAAGLLVALLFLFIRSKLDEKEISEQPREEAALPDAPSSQPGEE